MGTIVTRRVTAKTARMTGSGYPKPQSRDESVLETREEQRTESCRNPEGQQPEGDDTGACTGQWRTQRGEDQKERDVGGPRHPGRRNHEPPQARGGGHGRGG